ncbi:unnamed protein product [Adineta steineri]|uniref:Ig-like domain-containing protein n=1 Tax=Adineta steineri TaxID=433720 RepID=A0A816E2S8_9BILA|nr:unnamed protein product [Adineta steineri]CAF1644515.1 unnamed protein product [Adineta steineri]
MQTDSRSSLKRVTAEYGSDLSLSCTFQNKDSDEIIVQWLFQNSTDTNHRRSKSHWKPLFLNTQSLIPRETRYSIQQKIQKINRTFIAYSTILTLTKITDSDEGLYMCKSLLPKTIQMTYQVQVIQSLDINPKQLIIPSDEMGKYSIQLSCILKDNHTNRRHHDIFWWHNNKRLGSRTNRYARIIKNFTQHSVTSTLFYTGDSSFITGNYVCESEPLRRHISVKLQTNISSS